MMTEERKSRLVSATVAALFLGMLAWVAHQFWLVDRGYQSAQLSEVAKPLTDVMERAHVDSLECVSFDVISIELYGQPFKLPIDNPADRCPLEHRLYIDKDHTVRIVGYLGYGGADPRILENDLKSRSISERREQFKHLAAQVQAKAEELAKEKADWEAKERKRIEDERAAKVTWSHA